MKDSILFYIVVVAIIICFGLSLISTIAAFVFYSHGNYSHAAVLFVLGIVGLAVFGDTLGVILD